MAKKNGQSGFGDDESTPAVEEQNENPTVADLLAGPKTMPTGGDGTGGRAWVYSGSTMRQQHQGDQVRPQCPMCSNDQVAVLCTAYSSPSNGTTFTTRYKCPRCSFSTQKLRPGVNQAMRGQRQMKPAAPFVERP